MTLLPLPRLASSGLSAPTSDDFKRLMRAVDPFDADAYWLQLCAETGVDTGAVLLDEGELFGLAKALVRAPGAMGLVGRVLAIRIESYVTNAAHPDAHLWMPKDWGRKALETLLRTRIIDVPRLQMIAELNPFAFTNQGTMEGTARHIADGLKVELAIVSTLLDGAQGVVGKADHHDLLPTSGVPIEWSMCATMVRTGQPLVYNDLQNELLQYTNPVVRTGDFKSYSAVPMKTDDGTVIGSCCVITQEKREFTAEDTAFLERAAADAVAQLQTEARRADWQQSALVGH